MSGRIRLGGRMGRVTEKTDRSFSNGQAVDSIETEKSRIVLRELEKGWWILAVSRSDIVSRTVLIRISR